MPSVCIGRVPIGNFVAKLGCHEESFYYKILDIRGIHYNQQFCYGPCWCNEWDALQHRHLLAELPEYLSSLVLGFNYQQFIDRKYCYKKLNHQEMIKEMDSKHKSRYNNVFRKMNKVGKMVYRDWETDRKSTRLNSSHRL